MKHEILQLNRYRAYVLVKDVWYDVHVELSPRVGQQFLNGQIKRVLSFEEYKTEFPESKEEMYDYISDKTASGGFIRRVVDAKIKYGAAPVRPKLNLLERESIIN
jgi:hypothetical protein